MSRAKAKTTVVLSVRMDLPPGATIQEALAFTRHALSFNFKGEKLPEAYTAMDDVDKAGIKVSLQKRITEY